LRGTHSLEMVYPVKLQEYLSLPKGTKKICNILLLI
jgi:hypothetical protein